MDFIPYKWTREHLNFIITESKHKLLNNTLWAEAFKSVDRLDFVSQSESVDAYADKDLDIGYGERLNRATVIATILNILNPQLGGKYLEIGSGTGYVLALLGQIVGKNGKVIGMERILTLVTQSRERLKPYNEHSNIEVIFKDGVKGYEEEAPYNGILCSFAFPEIPTEFKKQLKIGGILIVPISGYDLGVITRVDKDSFKQELIHGFIFDSIKTGVE